MVQKENKMGIMPVNKLVITMSLPMIISMLIMAFYNIVDSYFVNMLATEAFDAVSISFSVQNLMVGVATGTAVGVNALLSRKLGEGDVEGANKVGAHGVLLAGVGFVIFLIFGLFCARPFFNLYAGKITPVTIEYGVEYISICTIFSFGLFGQVMFERLMQSTGKTIYTLLTQGLGAIINIILDPILIFGYFGFPEMGVAGAAAATVIGQIIAFIIAFIINQRQNKYIHLKFKYIQKIDFKLIGNIYYIGVPSMIMVGIGSLMMFCMNQILGTLKQTAITVFGAYYKLQSLIFMPVFGLNNGIIPIVAYNYGAQNRKRMIKAVKLGVVYAMSIMAIGTAMMLFFPENLLSIFITEHSPADLIETGVPALKILSTCFIFAGFCILLGSVYQALGKSMFSTFVSFSRQILVLIPAAYLLSLTGKVELVWWSFPIAEVASVTVTIICFTHLYKTMISKIPDGNL